MFDDFDLEIQCEEMEMQGNAEDMWTEADFD